MRILYIVFPFPAELRNRKSQGHCFINLGYAHSQLKELDKAGESFLHAAQAAKDCGKRFTLSFIVLLARKSPSRAEVEDGVG